MAARQWALVNLVFVNIPDVHTYVIARFNYCFKFVALLMANDSFSIYCATKVLELVVDAEYYVPNE